MDDEARGLGRELGGANWVLGWGIRWGKLSFRVGNQLRGARELN